MDCKTVTYLNDTYTVVDVPVDAGYNFVERHIFDTHGHEAKFGIHSSTPVMDTIKDFITQVRAK